MYNDLQMLYNIGTNKIFNKIIKKKRKFNDEENNKHCDFYVVLCGIIR